MYLHVSLAAVLVLMATVAGCSQPSAAPTQAPSVPKAAEPTKAPATAAPAAAPAPTAAPAVSTAAPAARTDYPQKGRPITMILPWTAGSSPDITSRLLAPFMEKDLGTSVEIVNKAGAGQQVGLTDLTQAKPDGHTLAYVSGPGAQVTYLDPERKAPYGRKDIQPVAHHNWGLGAIAVSASGPYKSVADMVNYAKANPEKFTVGAPGIMTAGHLMVLQLQQMTGAKFSVVQFAGGPAAMAAVIGGHVDAYAATAGDMLSFVQNGTARVIAVAGKQQSEFMPGVKTFEEQGYKIYATISNGLIAPAGTPKDVIAALSASVKRASSEAEHRKKVGESTAREVVYMDTPEFESFWTEVETTTRELMPLAQTK